MNFQFHVLKFVAKHICNPTFRNLQNLIKALNLTKIIDKLTSRTTGGLRGLHIKAVHSKTIAYGEPYMEMLWHTGSYLDSTTLLWYDRNKVPYEFNTAYRWVLKYR